MGAVRQMMMRLFSIYTGNREPSICTGSSNLFIIAPVQLVSAKPHIALILLGSLNTPVCSQKLKKGSKNLNVDGSGW